MKTSYAITSKLLRVVAVLILQYHDLLTTETEIFLSLIMKFLDPDKPSWQNGSALEVIHKIVVQPKLMAFICTQFDMNEHSTNVFKVCQELTYTLVRIKGGTLKGDRILFKSAVTLYIKQKINWSLFGTLNTYRYY